MNLFRYNENAMTNNDLDGFWRMCKFDDNGLSIDTVIEDEIITDAALYAGYDMTFEEALEYIMERVVEV